MFGKIIGAYFGYSLTAPLGLGFLGMLLGLFLGAKFDNARNNSSYFFNYTHSRPQQSFFHTSFAVMGYVAKFDGVVSSREINVAEDFMLQLKLNLVARKQAINDFNRGKSTDFDLMAELSTLVTEIGNNYILLHMFVDIQNKAAMADGITTAKARLINKISAAIGLPPRYKISGSNYQDSASQYNYNSSNNNKQHELEDAYSTLAITADATDAEVKTAYRKLLGKHHPDRLVSKGLPKELLKIAHEKTVAIKKSYDLIKKHRNIK